MNAVSRTPGLGLPVDSGGVKEKDAFFQLIPTDAHSRTPLRCVTDFGDTKESAREWKLRYEKLPQVTFHDSKSDQEDAQAGIDPNLTHDLLGDLNQGNKSRLKDPPPQSLTSNPD